MTPWTYDDLLAFLDRLGEQRIVPGLERMQEACARLGHPEGACPAIHIAGTNGKGSTGAFLRSIFQTSGARVAHYTSPHLIDFAERMTIDGVPLAHATLAVHGARVRATCVDLPLTYFEFATLIAFAAFAEARPDVAIIEVGMGGRLDATNVITPRVSIITPIGLDHQSYLGDTIAAIAAEKCGIIKPGVPVVSAPQTPEVMAAIRATCVERGAPLTLAEPVGPDVALGLPGAHQRCNAGVALATTHLLSTQEPSNAHEYCIRMDLTLTDAAMALAGAEWPGRCEWLSHDPPILFDGAHNVPGAAALAAYIADVRQGRSVTCVLGVMQDKDAAGIVAALCPVVDRFIAVTPPTSRALPAEELAAIIEKKGTPVESSALASVLTYAHTHTRTHAPLLVITGSLSLYAPARSWASGAGVAG